MNSHERVGARVFAVLLAVMPILLAVRAPRASADDPLPPPRVVQPKSAAYDWLDVALEATAREHDRNGPPPTVGSRLLGLVVRCMNDPRARGGPGGGRRRSAPPAASRPAEVGRVRLA